MPQRYFKLPGRGLFALSFSRNWLGDDHLLAVSSFLGVEHYKRYYFKDIEAFIVRRTSGRLIWNIVLLGLAGLLTVLAASVWYAAKSRATLESTRGPQAFLAGSAVLCLLLALGNSFRGRTCAVYIQTSSRRERLPALLRVGTAELAIGRLRRAIAAAQLVPESASPASEAAS